MTATYASGLAEALAADALERFLRYARIDTQSAMGSDTYPSTLKQLDLSRLLAQELRDLDLADVELTEHGLVFATLPGSAPGAPAVGVIAHVDTAPDASGTGVRPIVHRAYDGGALALPGAPDEVLDPGASPDLADCVGHDIVTSDGTTLLGADDKAGVAAIMAAAAHLAAEGADAPPRAPLRIGFTVDEEVGAGTAHFDVDAFGAPLAYTLDGVGRGSLDVETFSADSVAIVIHGRPVHPGMAKGKLVNAVKLAADLIAALPRDTRSPETTAEREGFVHPYHVDASEETARIGFIARDHDDAELAAHVQLLRDLAARVAAAEPRARVEVQVSASYRNMRAVLDDNPRVVEAAEEAIRRAGVEPRRTLIRGGTDGAMLTARGLPTPNIFMGGREFHSVREWLSVQDLAASAATVVELARGWAQES
jgi:tripeptide aminopeptidase